MKMLLTCSCLSLCAEANNPSGLGLCLKCVCVWMVVAGDFGRSWCVCGGVSFISRTKQHNVNGSVNTTLFDTSSTTNDMKKKKKKNKKEQ
jgi:hypothetical protein